jgi:peptide-methionine (R)-S-oxide reductase
MGAWFAFAASVTMATWLLRPAGGEWATAVRKGEGEMSRTNSTSEADWRKKLSEEQYRVLRCGGTERAFTGKYWDHHGTGVYACAACGQELFRSAEKYESGSGWPSFWQTAAGDRVTLRVDDSLGTRRTEVLCSRCGGHLGHVFDDGPQPTGLRIFYHSEQQKQAAEKAVRALQAKLGKPVVTQIAPAGRLWPAEDYHQDYYRNNRQAPYCRAVIEPKLQKLRR